MSIPSAPQDRDITGLLNLYNSLNNKDQAALNRADSHAASHIANHVLLKSRGSDENPEYTFTAKRWYDKAWGAICKFFGFEKNPAYDFHKHFQTLSTTLNDVSDKKINLVNELPDEERKKLHNLRNILNEIAQHVDGSTATKNTSHFLTPKEEMISELKEQGHWCEDKIFVDNYLPHASFVVVPNDDPEYPFSVWVNGIDCQIDILYTTEDVQELLRMDKTAVPKSVMVEYFEVKCETDRKGTFFIRNADIFAADVENSFEYLSANAQKTVIKQYAATPGYKDFAFDLLVKHLKKSGNWSDDSKGDVIKAKLEKGAPYVACPADTGRRVEICILEKGPTGVSSLTGNTRWFLNLACGKNFDSEAIRRYISDLPLEGAETESETETGGTDFTQDKAAIEKGEDALEKLRIAYDLDAIRAAVSGARKTEIYENDYRLKEDEKFKNLLAVIFNAPSGDDAAIKSGYRKIVLKIHPDRNSAHIELFKFIDNMMQKAKLK